MKRAVRFFFVLVLAVFSVVLPNYYRVLANPYRLAKSNFPMPFRPEWEVPISEENKSQIISILLQPFTYLGKGVQSYAFLSADRNYVLKLFRCDSSQLKQGQKIVEYIEKKFNKNARSRRNDLAYCENMFNASKISYERLPEETGLVLVHLNLHPEKWPLITIKDYLGFIHYVDAAETRFVLQKRADKIFPTLSRALREDRDLFNRMIRSFASLLSSFEKKGISIDDAKMPSNFGFLKDRAIQIDFASNSDNSKTAADQTEKFRARMRSWLQIKAPDALQYLND